MYLVLHLALVLSGIILGVLIQQEREALARQRRQLNRSAQFQAFRDDVRAYAVRRARDLKLHEDASCVSPE